MEQEKTAATILRDTADLLESDPNFKWGQGSYHRYLKASCKLCAHGAIAYCGDEDFKQKIDQRLRAVFGISLRREAFFAVLSHNASGSYSAWLEKHPEYKPYDSQRMRAHFYATEAGLTTGFNDGLGRTKGEVIVKLRKAAEFAERYEK